MVGSVVVVFLGASFVILRRAAWWRFPLPGWLQFVDVGLFFMAWIAAFVCAWMCSVVTQRPLRSVLSVVIPIAFLWQGVCFLDELQALIASRVMADVRQGYALLYLAVAWASIGVVSGVVLRKTFILRRDPISWWGWSALLPLGGSAWHLLNGGGMTLAASFGLGGGTGWWIGGHSLVQARQAWDRLLRYRVTLVLLCVVAAFILRASWGLRVLALTGSRYLVASDDGQTYHRLALTLLKGERISPQDGMHWSGVGYWWFLLGVYKLWGAGNFHAVILVQSFLGALVPLCMYGMGTLLFGRSLGLWTAVLCVFQMTLVFLSGILGMEALFIPLVYLALLASIAGIRRGWFWTHRWYAAMVGGCFGLANLARQELWPFVVLLVCGLMFAYRRQVRTGSVTRACAIVLAVLGATLVLHASWNYWQFGSFTFLNDQAGVTFAGGYGSPESARLAEMGFNPFQDLLRSLSIFAQQPGEIARLFVVSTWRKAWHYLFVPNFGTLDPLLLINPIAVPNRYALMLAWYTFCAVLVGLLSLLRVRALPRERFLLLGYGLYTWGLYAMLKASNARHRGVLEPCFLMLAVYGSARIIRWLREGWVGVSMGRLTTVQ